MIGYFYTLGYKNIPLDLCYGSFTMKTLLPTFAILAGMLLPIQAGLNALLTKRLGHPLHSAAVSFCVGTAGLITLCLLIRIPVPDLTSLSWKTSWLLLGGLMGAAYVTATILLAPRLGATAMIGLIVAGQLAASVLLDHYGLIGFPVRPATVAKIIGIALIAAGVSLVLR